MNDIFETTSLGYTELLFYTRITVSSADSDTIHDKNIVCNLLLIAKCFFYLYVGVYVTDNEFLGIYSVPSIIFTIYCSATKYNRGLNITQDFTICLTMCIQM